MRETFYDTLEDVVRSVTSRDHMVIAGDFNAKTGRECDRYPENIGRYGKGELNSNGKELLEFCNRQNLILTNTLFRHKMAHRSTWESPANHTESGRRNPYRNMIDYIITRKDQRRIITDSRSHNGLMTFTDHRLVRATFNMRRLYVQRENNDQKADLEKLQDPIYRAKYAMNLEMKIMDEEERDEPGKEKNAQQKWDNIVKSSHESAEEVLGKRKKHRKENQTIQRLSEEQKKIHQTINATKEEDQKKELKKERNKKLKEIQLELGKEKQQKIEREIREIEEAKDDSNRMFKAVKNLKRMKGKTTLSIDCEGGKTTDEETQTKIISDFFQKMFNCTDAEEINDIPPTEMRDPFTEQEIKKAIKSLKNNKSPGIDQITAEHLKYGPDLVCEKIAELLNYAAATGDFPKELNCGILVPLQKPGKKKGPPSNLRPIILLSMLRKILAICLIRRVGDRIEKEIPPSQAAYRSGRGTTEQLLTIKLMAEKAAHTPNYKTNLLLMDMSKAFDRVRRGLIMEDLKTILQDDELHLIKILMENVRLAVRVGKVTGEHFKTNIGVPQGDCLSPILFTLYLAKALSTEKDDDMTTENHTELAPHLRDHCYSQLERTGTFIPLQYADDICWLGMNCDHSITSVKKEIPRKLAERNLLINEDKTEEYTIERNKDDRWRKCKYLGTMLDTEEDIKRRKILTNDAMDKIKHIIKDRRLDANIKIRAFNAYASSVFLYNSETWTVSKTTEEALDSYHRRMMRNAINIRWPNKISSSDLYDLTKQTPWSNIICKRRVRLYGHLLRLPVDTPIRIAMEEYDRPLKMARGARKFSWKKNIDNDLCKIGIDRQKAKEVAGDRKQWRLMVRSLDAG